MPRARTGAAVTLDPGWTKHLEERGYVIVPDAGHSAMEPGIRRALVAATEGFKALA